jgi:methionyl-tRNA formyltransferase
MRFGLLAAGGVGRRVAEVIAGAGQPLEWLILDAADPESGNDAILAALEAQSPGRIVTTDELASEADVAALGEVDVGLVAWWLQIIRPPLLDVPRRGFLNLHPSLLPHDRGMHSIYWTFVEGSPFGVSIHWVDAGVDTGPIAFQRPLEKSWLDSGETLYARAQDALVELLREKWPEIARGDIPSTPQDLAAGSAHHSRDLEAGSRLDLDAQYTGRELLDLLRAYSFPPDAAWFEDGGRRYRVRVRITPD